MKALSRRSFFKAGLGLLTSTALPLHSSPNSQNTNYTPSIVLDSHVDSLLRTTDMNIDLMHASPKTQANIPLWQSGGVNAIWFSVWVDTRMYKGDDAITRARLMIESYYKQLRLYPNILAPCHNAEEIRRETRAGKIACMLAVEGGIAINNNLRMLEYYRKLGARYMTLTWRDNLDWAGSSQSSNPRMGLTDFGLDVIREMNRQGIIVDLSHASDQTFHDALKATSKPAIVSHSNARLLSPHPRNITDPMLKKLADNGGVIGVNFNGDFLRESKTGGLERRPGGSTIETVLDQIDHIVKVAGIDSVGIGSDFDGGITPARGLENASKTKDLWSGLIKRGYKTYEIDKIAALNMLRVLSAND